MPPQFVDLNEDGYIDIVTAAYEGFAYLISGSKDGFCRPEKICNEQGDPISFPDSKLTSVTSADWDHDGDQDLIVGNDGSGTIHLVENVGTRSNPKFSSEYSVLLVGSSGIRVHGITNVVACDWNKDGLVDLICGSHENGVFLFENEGTKRTPLFWKKVQLVAPFKASVTVRNSGDRKAEVHVVDNPTPCTSCTVSVHDYNSDGVLDLVVGCNSRVKFEKDLTPNEKTQLKTCLKEVEKLDRKLNGSLASDGDFERYNELSQRIWNLELPQSDVPMIWVFQK